LLAADPARGEEKFRLGFGGALLGNLATYGLSTFYGLEFAVLDKNKKGGIQGRQVEIVSEDDSCNPAQATAAATKLLSSGIKFVIGHSCSGATRSALSVYGDKALVISSSATENSLTESGQNPYFFRTTPRDDIQAKLLGAFIKKKGYKKIAILHDKAEFGHSMAEMIKQFLESQPDSPETVIFEGITTGQVSFDAIVSKIKDSEAEALFWGGYYNDAAKLITQMRQKKVAADFIGTDGLFDLRFVNIAQRAAEGTYCAGQVDFSQNEAARAAVADHRRRYYSQDIGTYFFYAAGAAQALFAALEKTGLDADFPTVKRRLNEDTVETVMGPIRFDAKGDVIGAGFKLFVVENGRFVEVGL
jgi:branched-chain amino acid transport system substrate-binding protein